MRDISHILQTIAETGRPKNSQQSSTQDMSSIQLPREFTQEDKDKLYKHIRDNPHDHPDAVNSLALELGGRHTTIELEKWLRAKRMRTTVQMNIREDNDELFSENDAQIMQLILNSNRNWKSPEYIDHLVEVLRSTAGSRQANAAEVREWMMKMNKMDARNGLISSVEYNTQNSTLSSGVSHESRRRATASLSDGRTAWSEFLKDRSKGNKGIQHLLRLQATDHRSIDIVEEVWSEEQARNTGKYKNRGNVTTALLSAEWKEMPEDKNNDWTGDQSKRSYWRLKATPGWELFRQQFEAEPSNHDHLRALSEEEKHYAAYKAWVELRKKEKAELEFLEATKRAAELPITDIKRKAREYEQTLKDVAASFVALGGDIVIMGGNASADTNEFFWARGTGAEGFFMDYERANIGIWKHFTGRMEIGRLRNEAKKCATALARTLIIEPADPVISTSTERSDSEHTSTVRTHHQHQIKEMLKTLPITSNVPLLNESGNFTRNFWEQHYIDNWPRELPDPLIKPITKWVPSLCIEAMSLFKDQGYEWYIKPRSQPVGFVAHTEEVPVDLYAASTLIEFPVEEASIDKKDAQQSDTDNILTMMDRAVLSSSANASEVNHASVDLPQYSKASGTVPKSISAEVEAIAPLRRLRRRTPSNSINTGTPQPSHTQRKKKKTSPKASKEPEYAVEKVLRHRQDKLGYEFFVSWVNYSSRYNSWLRIEELTDDGVTCYALLQYIRKMNIKLEPVKNFSS